LPLSSTWRTSETDTTSNSYGLPTLVKDLGDTSTSSDDTCIATSYATADTTRWLINFPSQVVTTDCATTPGDADYLSGSQTFYDGSATLGATPTLGHPTRSTDLAWVTSGVQTWKQNDRIDYDSYGRESATYDSLDNQTIRQYVPATGGPVTQTKEFNPKGWGTYTNVEPGHGSITSTVDENSRTTSAAYDPLGRIVKVWANNRATSSTPDTQYSYGVSSTAPNWIETQKLGPTGAQVASYAIFDGQDRLRQNQDATPVANGGREISDTAYDSRGLKVRTSQFFNSTAAPGPTLATFADTDVPTQDRFTFDNLERETLDAFYSMGTQKWTDATSYQGDRMAETPPTGGITTQKMLDTDGKVTELRQFTSTNLSGSFTATDYTLDRLGNLTKVVDPAGNTWSWTYDLRGRVTQSTDPDSGTTSNTYDDNDQLLTSKDGRDVTIAYAYDNLGRKTDAYLGSTAGTHLDNWTYDTLAKGQLATQTQWQNGNPYITGVTSYDDAYRKLGVYVTLPTVEGSALAATWTTNYTYNPDGSVATTVYPAAGGLGSETVTNTYDANGFQLTAAGLDTYLSSAQYQPWGDVYKRFLGTGSSRVQVTTDEWADTHKARLLSVATEHPGTPNVFDEAFTQQYNWSGDEEITSIDSMHGGSVVDSQCFGYDYEQQLTTAFTTTSALGGCGATPSTSTVGGADPYWQTYTYDGSNNRTSLVSHGLAGVADTTSGYTYPAAATPKAHTLSGVSTTGPGAATANSYTYLGGGQLSDMTVGGRSTDFTYTSDGSVQSATIHATGGDQATTYLYDADGNEILRDTPTGKTLYLGHTDINTNATGSAITSVTRYYSVEDTVVASRNNPGTLSWLANDDQNTALVAVAQVGLAVAVRKEDPFGNARGAVPNWPNPRGFVGGTTEPDGLVHLGARMYDPTTGRFTSDDEVTDADNPEQINGYAYAYNSPLTYSDPDGRWGFKSFLHKVASVASVVSIIPGPIGSIAAGVAAVAYAGSGDWKNAAIMVAGIAAAAVGAGAAVLAAKVAIRGAKVVRTAAKAYQMSRKMAKVARLGRYGEKAARIVKNTRRIPSIVKGRYHIPDEIDDVRKIVHEVKNTKKLGYTRQIKSFHRYAKSKGYDFHISIRKGNGTRLSKPLQDLERRGEIVFRRIL
jgi:RHS repeat-associated protein